MRGAGNVEVGGRAGLQGGRHYVESSGSDLMIFFSTLPDVRCNVPFSERVDDRDSIIGLELHLANPPSAT